MSKLAKKIVRNTGYLAIGNQVANLLQFIFFLYFGRLFGEAAVGQYSFGLSFTYTFAIFADLGISIYLIREVACDKTGSRRIFFDGLVLRMISLLFVLTFAVIIFPLISRSLSLESIYIIGLIGLYQIFYSLADVFAGELKGREEMGVVAFIAILSKAVIVSLGFLLIASKVHYRFVMIAFPIGGFVNLLAIFLISRLRLGPLTVKFENLQYYYRLFIKALPFGSALILVQGIACQDILILRFLSGDVSVGYFSVAIKIAGVIAGMTVFLYETILPILTKLFIESREKLIAVSRKLLKYLFIIGLPLSVGMVMCADKIVVLLYRDKFGGSIAALRIIGWIISLGILQTLFSAILTAIGKQSVKAICWGINLTVTLILNLILTYSFDYVGTSVARLISEVLTTVLFVYLVGRYLVALPFLNLMFKPGLACISMALFIYVAHSWHLAILIPSSALLYTISLLLLGTFTKEEMISAKNFCLRRIPLFGTESR
jgi:O-antigen/teichoic acid export membrane protein